MREILIDICLIKWNKTTSEEKKINFIKKKEILIFFLIFLKFFMKEKYKIYNFFRKY